MTNKLLEHQRALHKQIEAYYEKKLAQLKFELTVSDTAIVDYLERVQLIPPSYAKYLILTQVLNQFKPLTDERKQIISNNVVFSVFQRDIKEISTIHLPAFHSLRLTPNSTILVTPHAIVRYLQRVEVIPIVECRYLLATQVTTFLEKYNLTLENFKGLSSWEAKIGKLYIVLKGNIIVTVY